MTGRTRLSWVTALTIASLMLGGGALNAFAEHGGGKGNGNGNGNSSGNGKVEHVLQQPQHPAAEKHDNKASGHAHTTVDAEYLEVIAVTRTTYELKGIPDDSFRDLSK